MLPATQALEPARAPVVVAIPPTPLPGTIPRPPAALAATVERLGRGFDGIVGIAVRDVQAGWYISFNGQGYFPQQSVSKLWVALTVFDAIDRRRMSLSDTVRIERKDLVVFHQPLRAKVGPNGYDASVSELLLAAMTTSDNLANDSLLRTVGGPGAVRAFLDRAQLDGIRFGPGERLLQAGTAGLPWRQSYAEGNAFFVARAALPFAVRRAALDKYLADPIDGAQPEKVALALARLRKGDLLSPESTQRLLTLMASSRTGPQRMRAGSGPGWAFAHKTGTGQELGGEATGYNDIGLMTSPDGRTYALAVMIKSTRQPIPVRQRLMANVARAVVAQDMNGPRAVPRGY
ncbi:serine hydrolase [Sphingomonas montana]|uniref:serine hydrolase n=1 Tax=Sphingomonas montana TaxID=1843236 RepID=UPI0009F9E97A|nr:serine hydrolase [Sphingomonas montana]